MEPHPEITIIITIAIIIKITLLINMHKSGRHFLLLLYLCCFLLTSGQENNMISGKVIDRQTRQPLAFVNIIINDNNRAGGTTDIDGKFRLSYSGRIRSLSLTYVGYEPLTWMAGSKYQGVVIAMTRTEVELKEVEILPGINPANRIIQNAIDNRDTNDPEKLHSFSYTSYDKTIFTIDADTSVASDFKRDTTSEKGPEIGITITSAEGKKDSLQKDSLNPDTINQFLSKLIKRQYLFLMENVTKRKFLYPDKNYNQVIASKMSGFKDPIFVFLTTQIQSFSFINPSLQSSRKPMSTPSAGEASASISSSLRIQPIRGKNTLYIIKFRPRKGTNFDGLKGVISINTNKWGIQNVIAEPYENAGGFAIRIRQLYDLIDGEHWFPVQLNTDVAFNNMRIGKIPCHRKREKLHQGYRSEPGARQDGIQPPGYRSGQGCNFTERRILEPVP